MLKKMNSIMIVLVLLVSLCACGGTKPSSSQKELSKIEQIKAAGVLKLGTSADYPPYEFHLLENGTDKIVGFDIAFAQYFADALGVKLEITDMKFESLITSLSMGEFDIVLAGLTPDEKRAQVVDFTDVILTNKQIVMVRTEEIEKYKTTEDLAGAVIGYQTGTIQEGIAKSLSDNTVGLVKFTDLIMQLQQGQLDAVCTNSMIALSYESNNPDVRMADVGIVYENTGFAGAVQKGEEEFLAYLNTLIQEMKDKGLVDQYVAEAQALAASTEE